MWKRNKTIKKNNLSYRDLNLFNEDISHASIVADPFNTRLDMLLTDVNTDEMYKIIINICMEICKKHVLPKKSPRKHQITRDRRALMRKLSKLRKTIQRSTNHQTKESVQNRIKEIENNFKISMNTEINLWETRAIAAINKNPKYFYKFVKTTQRSELELDLSRMNALPTWNQATNKMSELLNEQYNISSSALRT